jgi:hypothetical protein
VVLACKRDNGLPDVLCPFPIDLVFWSHNSLANSIFHPTHPSALVLPISYSSLFLLALLVELSPDLVYLLLFALFLSFVSTISPTDKWTFISIRRSVNRGTLGPLLAHGLYYKRLSGVVIGMAHFMVLHHLVNPCWLPQSSCAL